MEPSFEDKIEFLEGYRKAKADEENFKIESEALLNCKIIPSQFLTGMPKAQNQADLSKLQILIEEKAQEYITKRYKAAGIAARISDCINRLENETEKTVLLLRYIKLDKNNRLNDWNYIADKMGYSRAMLYKHFKSAVNNLQIDTKKIKE